MKNMINSTYEYELVEITFEIPYEAEEQTFPRFAHEDNEWNNESQSSDIEYDIDGIPMGGSQQEKNIRREIIHQFIQKWRNEHADNPRVFNRELNDYIKINQVFLLESVAHSAVKYQSTKAVLMMEEIMTNARKVSTTRTKDGNSNQKPFAQMMVMRYHVEGVGNVKMTIGIRKRTLEKVQYSITVPDAGTPFVDSSLATNKSTGKTKKKKRS